jgi:hypothetical protein
MDNFFKSELVQEELIEMQRSYNDLLSMSQNLQSFNPEEKLEHIEKTLELISKQKVFYARLQLMSHQAEENEAVNMKSRIDTLSMMFSGQGLLQILDEMEAKLIKWKNEITESRQDP